MTGGPSAPLQCAPASVGAALGCLVTRAARVRSECAAQGASCKGGPLHVRTHPRDREHACE